MSNKYSLSRTTRLKYSWLLIVAFLFSQNVWSQVSAYTFSQTSGTYSAITGGTVVNTATGNTSALSMDSYASGSITIPFSFVYNGSVVTGSYMSSNGFLTLGTTAPGSTATTPISGTATAVGNIAAWGGDLNGVFNIGGFTSEMRYELQGSPGSQVMIYQWKNFRPNFSTSTTQAYLFDFQIKLYEGTNKIEVVYGGNLAFAIGSTAISGTRQIGLRGSSNADFNNRTNTTLVSFTASSAGTLNSSTQAWNSSALPNMPTSGLTYNWTAPSCWGPSGVAVATLASTSVNMTWNAAAGSPAGYQWEIRTSGAAGSGATGLVNSGSVVTNAASVTGLTANTSYSFYVRSDCGGTYSAWSSAFAVFTGYCTATSTSSTSFISNVTTSGAAANLANASGGYSTTGYGDFTAQSVTVQQGTSFTISVSNNDDVGIRVYVDWNNDLDFADAGETVAGSGAYLTSPYVYTSGAIAVGGAQALGSYRMRVRSDWNSTTPAACGSITRGETEDYTLIVSPAPTCFLPTGLTSSISSGSATISWTAPATGTSPASYNWELRTSGAAGSGATGLVASGVSVAPTTGATISSGLVLNTTYTYYVQSNCGGGDLSNWTSSTFFYGYCVPVTTTGCTDGDVVARVTLNTLDNNSGTGCPSGLLGYSDYTADPLLTTALQAGGSYSCTVYAGQYAEGYAVWIDYNDDFTFATSERVGFSIGQVAGSGSVGVLGSSASFPINLACNPPLGTHRMRVRAMYNTNGSAVTPCTNNTYGETEDYVITITTPVSCPAPTAPVASNPTYNSVDLAWTNGCTETAWNIEYGPTGFTPGTGTIVPVTSNPATITGLSSVTAYQFYVSADCGVIDGESAQTPIPASATTLQAPCSGTPDAGTLALSGACSGVSFSLNPTGGTWTDLGLTYAWESSPDGSAWTDMGVSSAVLTTSQTVGTYYHRITTCTNSGLSATTNDLFIPMNAPTACYCIPTTTFGCTDGDVIARVTLNTLDNNSGTGCPSAPLGYSDYTSDPLLTTTLQAGGSYSCTVYAGQYSEGYAAWIDYNDDGIFDNSTERIGYSAGQVTGSGSVGVLGSSASFPIVLACNPPLGVHRLRVRAMYATNGNAVTPCTNNSFGEVEDYLVTISAPVPCPAPSNLLWTAATSNSVSLTWTAGCTETSWELEYGATGYTSGTGTVVSAPTNPGTIGGLAASTTYDVYVRATCGGSNGNSSWVGPVSVTTGCAAAPLTYSQGFNGGAPCWLVQSNVSGTASVSISTGGSFPTTSPYESTGMLYFNSFGYNAGAQARAISAPLSSLTETSVDVEFQWRNENNPTYTSANEGVQVQYSLDGTTWTDAGAFITRHDGSLASGTAAWKKKTITLPPACAGQSEFFVGLLFTSAFGDNCFLDAFVAKQTPPCPAFTDFTAVSLDQTTVEVTITGNPGENAVVEYGPQGFTPGTGATAGAGGTVVLTSTLSAVLSLSADSFYDIYVRKDCSSSADGYSENSDRVTINTYAFVPTSGSNQYTTCSSTIYDSAIDGDYSGDANGYTVVYPASTTGLLTLAGPYDVDGSWDYIDIYEGEGTGGTYLGTYVGTGNLSVQASAPNTPLTIIFVSSQWSSGGAGFAFTASCQEVCTNIPSNAPLTGNASVCPGEGVDIQLVTPEVGLNYIWQKRTTAGGTWTTIAGETSPMLSVTQTVATEYRARLNCDYYNNAGATVPTQSWFVTMNSPTTCYCAPTYSTGTTAGDFIQSVVSGSINNNTGAGASPFYTVYPAGAGTTTTYTQGGQYSITVTPGTYTQNDVTAWIDYNQDGSFSESERLGQALNTGAGAPTTWNFTVPGTAVLGTTRLRVREADQSSSSIDPCIGLTYGETEDYFVTMAPGAANDAPANATVIAPPIYPACLNLTGDLSLATDDPLDASNGADLWYSFTASSNACRIAVSGGTATNVEIELQDSSAPTANTISTENSQSANGNEILITDDLQAGSQYWVAIRNAGGVAGTFTVCIQSLASSTCDNGPTFAGLCSSFKADWTGTGSYTATFTSVSNPSNVYSYTTSGTSSWIPLTVVTGNVGNPSAGGLQYGESYAVTVASNYSLPNAVGDAQTAVSVASAPTCTINILPAAPMNIGAAYRSTGSGSISVAGSNPRSLGSWVQSDIFMCGAIGYQWHITEVDYLNAVVSITPATPTTVARQVRLNAASIPGISAGKRYRVKVAPIFAWGTGSYDEASSFYVQVAGSAGMVANGNDTEVVLVDKTTETGVFASLYPNPSNGEMVNINIAGIESESVNIRIMDASGRTVWSNNFFVEGILATSVNFDRPLAAGVYMVEMTYNGEVSTQRMVVQK